MLLRQLTTQAKAGQTMIEQSHLGSVKTNGADTENDFDKSDRLQSR